MSQDIKFFETPKNYFINKSYRDVTIDDLKDPMHQLILDINEYFKDVGRQVRAQKVKFYKNRMKIRFDGDRRYKLYYAGNLLDVFVFNCYAQGDEPDTWVRVFASPPPTGEGKIL